MKKSLMLLVFIMASFMCVSGVSARTADEAFNEFVDVLETIVEEYNAENDYQFDGSVEDDMISICLDDVCQEFTYSNGILSFVLDDNVWNLSKEERQNLVDLHYYNRYFLDLAFIEMNDYDYDKFHNYIYSVDALNVNTHGYEYDSILEYTKEEIEEMKQQLEDYIKDHPEAAGAMGFGSSGLTTVHKLDLVNGLKNYDETVLPKYLFFDENIVYDAAKKDDSLIFECSMNFADFDKVYVNGSIVDPKYYTATEGSTIITFNNDYIKTLKNGTYTIKVADKDGEFGEAKFTVKNMPETVSNPKTGITNPLFIGGLGIIAAIGVVLFTNKKNLFNRI